MAKSFEALVRRAASPAVRLAAAARTRDLLAEMVLSGLRRAAGKTQRELARALGVKQPSLSKLESQDDMQIVTLQKYVAALGGKLEIVATLGGQSVRIKQFQQPKATRKLRSA